jgi:hypothetical protein
VIILTGSDDISENQGVKVISTNQPTVDSLNKLKVQKAMCNLDQQTMIAKYLADK